MGEKRREDRREKRERWTTKGGTLRTGSRPLSQYTSGDTGTRKNNERAANETADLSAGKGITGSRQEKGAKRYEIAKKRQANYLVSSTSAGARTLESGESDPKAKRYPDMEPWDRSVGT